MTTLTRSERHVARKRAQSQLADQHRTRYQELYQEARKTTRLRNTARGQATTKLANEYHDDFRRLFLNEVGKLLIAKQSAEEAALPAPGTPTPGLFFMDDPARGCNPETGPHPDTFFPSNGEGPAAARQRVLAIKTCRRCPFTDECFAWADSNGQEHGIWGGVDMGKTSDREEDRATLAVRA